MSTSASPMGRWWAYDTMSCHVAPANGHLLDLLGEPPGRLIDIGAGTGAGLEAAGRRGWSVLAIDPAAEQLGQAEATGAPLVRANGQALPFRADPFDGALSNFALIFAADPGAVVAETRRCLRPGGKLAFTAWVPGGWPDACRKILAAALGRSAAPFPTGLGVAPAAHALLECGGFEVETVEESCLQWAFADLDDAVETLTSAAGGLRVLRSEVERLDRWPSVKRHLASALSGRCRTVDGRLTIDDRYLAVVGRASGS